MYYRFADFMEKFSCEIKGRRVNYDVIHDVTTYVMLSCQPDKFKRVGFKYYYDVILRPGKSKYDVINFVVPVCDANKMLTTEIVDFIIYKNNEGTDYVMRVPVGCE